MSTTTNMLAIVFSLFAVLVALALIPHALALVAALPHRLAMARVQQQRVAHERRLWQDVAAVLREVEE